jgi:hypothetical protein
MSTADLKDMYFPDILMCQENELCCKTTRIVIAHTCKLYLLDLFFEKDTSIGYITKTNVLPNCGTVCRQFVLLLHGYHKTERERSKIFSNSTSLSKCHNKRETDNGARKIDRARAASCDSCADAYLCRQSYDRCIA